MTFQFGISANQWNLHLAECFSSATRPPLRGLEDKCTGLVFKGLGLGTVEYIVIPNHCCRTKATLLRPKVVQVSQRPKKKAAMSGEVLQ